MPAFEYEVKRENYLKIPQNACGIYRYINGKDIVYIGKGNVRNRLNEPTRKEWIFDTIQYSLIEDNNSQLEWESFWITRFKTENDDRLPSYNLISGKDFS